MATLRVRAIFPPAGDPSKHHRDSYGFTSARDHRFGRMVACRAHPSTCLPLRLLMSTAASKALREHLTGSGIDYRFLLGWRRYDLLMSRAALVVVDFSATWSAVTVGLSLRRARARTSIIFACTRVTASGPLNTHCSYIPPSRLAVSYFLKLLGWASLVSCSCVSRLSR